LTDKMVKMVLLSALFGVLSTISGYYIAHFLDVSVAGMMATMTGIFFIAVFLFAPKRGYISRYLLKKEQRWDFAQKMLTVHLLHHEGSAESAFECSIGHLTEHINWEAPFANEVLKRARENQLIEREKDTMILTEKGRQAAVEAMNL